MIKVSYTSDKITISGHSNYDELGKDIVCSAVSSIVTTTINGIISIDENAILYQYQKDTLLIEIKSHDVVIEKLIDNMLDLLSKLAVDYPQNIKIKEGV